MTSEQLMEVNKGIEEWGLENVENVILIKYGATNGDMIKAMFPNIEVKTNGLITSVKGLDCDKGALDPYRQFWSEWWNAPYQKGGKGCHIV